MGSPPSGHHGGIGSRRAFRSAECAEPQSRAESAIRERFDSRASQRSSWGVAGMQSQPFQDRVDWHCFGCGRLNDHGLQIKSHWDGDDVVCRWRAEPFHVGLPGRVQGGVIATTIICHALWTATATACRNEGTEIREPMSFAYSTTSLQLEFLAPVPAYGLMPLRALVTVIDGATAPVVCSAFAAARECT